MYNPTYGYFSKEATIFTPGEPFDFNSFPDEASFNRELGDRYTKFEDALDEREYKEARQLWHTPTELFKPYYGEAIARYLVANYKLSLYPYHDLLIYEMGAGNGTLMLNILDYIRASDPEVYARTKFRVIEVSSALASLQTAQLARNAESRGHADKVSIINRSIFDWKEYVSSPCFFLAMEVFDNFAHDVIRYHPFTEEPLQGLALVDNEGDFFEFYSQTLDPVAARFLRVRDAACANRSYNHPLRGSRLLRNLRSKLPLAPNLSTPEYIPTRLMNFFDILREYFPAHRLVTSDFHALPDAIEGVNAPVVQTRYQRRTVLVRTPLVRSIPPFPAIPSRQGQRRSANVSHAGPPRLLRYPVPDRFWSHGGYLPRHYGQADARHDTRGFLQALGVCRRHANEERGEPAAELVQERQCHDHCVGGLWLFGVRGGVDNWRRCRETCMA